MQDLAERSTACEQGETEGDMIDVYDVADDLGDAIVEYQVSTGVKKYTLDSPLMQSVVLSAEGDLRSKLYADCKS